MRRIVADYWICIKDMAYVRRCMAMLLICGFAACLGNSALAQDVPSTEVTPYHIIQTSRGQALKFTPIETARGGYDKPPVTGWRKYDAQPVLMPTEMGTKSGTLNVIWARITFDRSRLPPGPIAIYTEDNREQITVFLNDIDVFRNFVSRNDNAQGWYRPNIFTLPKEHMRPALNTLVIRVDSRGDLGVGRFIIGPNTTISAMYNYKFFWRVDAPAGANIMMLILGLCAFVLWIVRREDQLIFLTLSSALWFVHGYHYYVPNMGNWDPLLFISISHTVGYLGIVASLFFYLAFLNIPWRASVLTTLTFIGFVLGIIHWYEVIPGAAVYGSGLAVALTTFAYAVYYRRSHIIPGFWILTVLMTVLMTASLHDFFVYILRETIFDLGFFLNPFIGFIFCITFLVAFGLRSQKAFQAVAHANQNLELRIKEARQNLSVSEAERRKLEVAVAVETERERIMREIHDGIGSNLVTAIAIAEKRDDPPDNVATLRRSLSDLRLAVDSLEPLDGDVLALLANFRHRNEADFTQAGLGIKWQVEDVPIITWLDPVNALHFLRVLQEIFSNVLSHASATIVTVSSRPRIQSERNGAEIVISDNGDGFIFGGHQAGKGLGNINARMHNIGGHVEILSALGTGTTITLWLPAERHNPNSAAVGGGN